MRIKVITMCGSMSFASEMQRIALDLELNHNFAVLQCVYDDEKTDLNASQISKLAKIHRKKIDLSDAIYVVNSGGYIGESTRSEIEYAMGNGKKVMFHE